MTDSRRERILHDIINQLSEALQVADLDHLTSVTGMIFARFLDYKLYERPTAQVQLTYDSQQVAAFILLTQLLFYQELSSLNPQFPTLPLLHLAGLEPLKDAFENKQLKEFGPIFAIPIVQALPNDAKIITAINAAIQFSRDTPRETLTVLTQNFAKIIPLEIRKHLAAFYTGHIGAEILCQLSIRSPRDVILDLACGTGTLLIHAYFRKKLLLNNATNHVARELQHHSELLQDLHGNDAIPFATLLAAVNLILLGSPTLGQASITAGDGFQVKTKIQDSHNSITTVNVVLMNPPFTRHERIAPYFLHAIQSILAEEGCGDYIAGKMSLQHYFLLHADQFLQKYGRLAFVLPANTFNVDLSDKLVRFLINRKYHLEYLIATNARVGSFSEDCTYKEYLFIATKDTLTPVTKTKLALFSNLPPQDSLSDFTEFLQNAKVTGSFERGGISVTVNVINTNKLYAAERWDAAFWNLHNPALLQLFADRSKLVPLAQSTEFTFITGFHSTHCDYLILPNRLFTVTRVAQDGGLEVERCSDGASLHIPPAFIRPCLRESKFYQRIIETPHHWVLSISPTDPLPTHFAQIFLDYTTRILQDAVGKKAKKGGKVRARLSPLWYTHPLTTGCDHKKGHLWTFNRYGLWRRSNTAFYTEQEVTGNDGFHIYNYVRTDIEKTDSLLLLNSWFNTSFHLFDFLCKCRVPATHVQQCLKPDRGKMYVPIIASLNPVERTLLLKETQYFADTVQGTILDQLGTEIRRSFDEAWMHALGIPSDQIQSILDELYATLKFVIASR